jgi:hypothetical protein
MRITTYYPYLSTLLRFVQLSTVHGRNASGGVRLSSPNFRQKSVLAVFWHGTTHSRHGRRPSSPLPGRGASSVAPLPDDGRTNQAMGNTARSAVRGFGLTQQHHALIFNCDAVLWSLRGSRHQRSPNCQMQRCICPIISLPFQLCTPRSTEQFALR